MGGKARLSTLRAKLVQAEGLLIAATTHLSHLARRSARALSAGAEAALEDSDKAGDLLAEVIDEVDL